MKETFLYAHLTWPEIRDLKKDHLVVVQPFAAIEDHGLHLPVESGVLAQVIGVQHHLDLRASHRLEQFHHAVEVG